jgi:methyl-accepting chemotaxis protein
MLRLSNIRIGIKLAIMSGLGVLLVGGMIATQMMGNSTVRDANELAHVQQSIAKDAMTVEALETRMQLAVRDIRLARGPENLQKALGNIDGSLKAVNPLIDSMVKKLRVPENRDRMQKVKALAAQYASGAKEIADMQSEIIRISNSGTPDAAARASALTSKREQFARDVTLPIAAQLDELTEKVRGVATDKAEKEVEIAAESMTSAAHIGQAVGFAAIVVLFGAAIFGAMTIARPLGKMAGVLVELTNDRIVDVPYTNRGDEIGAIAKATDVFKESIAGKVVNLRVRTALDTCQTNVMVADENYNIVYMNNTMLAMMQANEAELRKELPALDTKNLIGTCIDVFHKNPAHQRGILDKLTTTVRTTIKIAGLTFDLVVTPTMDKNGKRAGTVVEWQDVTKIRAIEETAFRVKSALDGCATNMMVSDENYNIIYMNETMMAMMKSNEANLRKVLPNLDTKKLIGTCIDVFHKNPAHQRGILDKLSSTIETDLELAGLNFHLVVSPIVDKNGKRLGTSVEWKDETAEKAVEREINGVVQAAVAGDFVQRVPTEGKKGFMLNLSNAMNGLCENTGKALDDLASMMGSLANGDMTQRINADYQGMFGKLKDDANKMADQIGATVADIKASAREVTNASAEISTSTTDLSQRTEEQAASLEETSASMEEISATVKKNAENAQQANQSAAGTRDVADRGGQVVAKAVDAMAKIEESSRKISDIIGVIDEIARQTNLLALNAAVEAARAGEAGRGFAVVASEVRSLAQRSSQAAKDIKDLITNSNGQVKDGVDLVNRAGTALTEIVDSIKKVADIVADISNASIEQSTGIEEVNKALTQMDEVTQQNSALVEENAATAKTLEHQAKAMDERVAFFKLDSNAESEHAAQSADAREQRTVAAASSRGPAAPSRGLAAPTRGPAAPKQQSVAAPKRVAAGANGGGPVGRMHAALATAVKNDPDWKEF